MLPGVFLMWDSSFLCADAPPSDSYKIIVRVENNATSVEAVEIKTITLVEKTPKPRGQTPPGEKTGATLPITLEPGDSEEFTVTGVYTLVQTDEGMKANHHYLAAGIGLTSEEIFGLGINVHFRAPGVAAE